jgi:hypothetical protein
MSEAKMPKRWSVGNYDGYMVEFDGGDYVEFEDVQPLLDEIERLRARVEMLEAALRDMLSGWRYIRETHGDLYGVGWDRAEGKASAALEAKP